MLNPKDIAGHAEEKVDNAISIKCNSIVFLFHLCAGSREGIGRTDSKQEN